MIEKYSSLYDDFEEDDDLGWIKITHGDWKTSTSKMTTGGLGPCIGVIIYNPTQKKATVGHFVEPKGENMEQMVAEAIKKIGTVDIKIYLGGGEVEENEQDTEYVKSNRNFALELLKDKFPKSEIKKRWGVSNERTEMRIDPKTGKVEYEIIDI